MLTVSSKEKGFIRYLNMNVEFTKFREFLRLRKLGEFIHLLASSLLCLKFQEISKLIPKIFKWRQKEPQVQADST
jgi:hypothetical protein